MPANQQSSNLQASGASKSPLVRSKSLRLPSSKPKNEPGSSSLSRHGSIRQSRVQPSSLPGSHTKLQQPFSTLKKPPVKPKPVFNSKSTENLTGSKTQHNGEDIKKQVSQIKSTNKQTENAVYPFAKGVTFLHDSIPLSDSPSSGFSERSSNAQDSSWNPDLAVHLKRLTEEHEKLQVEYARARIQLLDLIPSHPATSLKRELQHLSHSDSHLASIPENSAGSEGEDKSEATAQNQEILIQTYKAEVLRLQEENRKIQRKYWDQILNSEAIDDESNNNAPQQIVELIDKVDEKQRELLQSNNQVQELQSHIANLTFDLQQCQDALQDYQRMLEESNIQKDKLENKFKDLLVKLNEYKENIEFLQEERSSMAEALQDTENSLLKLESAKKDTDKRLNDLIARARKLYEKIQDKNLQNQLLQAELDRNEGLARDMLLSQGAELTMAAMHLSEITINLHNLLNCASDFAANHLDLQKEILEEITADLDSDGDKNSDLSPLDFDSELLLKSPCSEDNLNKTLPQLTTLPDIHKSMPDLPSSDLTSKPLKIVNDNELQPLSLVQSILQEAEKTISKDDSAKKTSLSELYPCRPVSAVKSIDSLSDNVSSSENNINKSPFRGSGAFKPVGTAIPFRPVTQISHEQSPITPLPATDTWNNDDDRKKASLEGQKSQLNILLGKIKKVIEMTHTKHLSVVQTFKDELSHLQTELKLSNEKKENLRLDLKLKSQDIQKLTTKLSDSSAELKQLKAAHKNEKEELLKQCSELKVQNKCLEAVNVEQLRQLKEEVQKCVDSSLLKQNTAYFSDAVAICDKLSLKQEVVRLKEIITQKENLLQTLAQKFAKTKSVLEDNLQKADNEVECLDGVIQKVYELLQQNPELVKSSDVLKSVFSLVSGNSTPESFNMADGNPVAEK